MTAPLRSRHYADTGAGLRRRRLTLDEALTGLLPEPYEPHEWLLMHMRSRQLELEAWSR